MKESKLPKKTFHFLSFLITAGVMGYTAYKGNFGVSVSGTCSIKGYGKSYSPFTPFYPVIIYLVVSIYTICYIKKYLPDEHGIEKQKRQLIR